MTGQQLDTMTGKPMIFVFGSNLAGAHGAGAAKVAREKHGAVIGVGYGPTGDAYAIPTKDRNIRTMSKDPIRYYVGEFKKYAASHPDLEFQVTRIGCGLAGYSDRDIAPMFKDAPMNCLFDTAWKPWFERTHRFWGHVA